MIAMLERLSGPVHVLLALLSAWLVGSSPWLHMAGHLPSSPGFVNLGHVVLGLAVLLLVIVYIVICSLGGRWRLYFPWMAGRLAAVRSDLGGLLRGRLPVVEGGGLFAMIEGLLLLALVATALSGAGWLLVQGTPAALAWSDIHATIAWLFAGVALLHLAAVSLHLLDFVRD